MAEWEGRETPIFDSAGSDPWCSKSFTIWRLVFIFSHFIFTQAKLVL